MRRTAALVLVGALAACGGARPGPQATASSVGSPSAASPTGTAMPVDACDRQLTALPATTPTYPVSAPGLKGGTVTVSSGSRVVATALGSAEIVYALGAGSRLVSRDLASLYPGAQDLPVSNPKHEIALESVLALHPDLVIGSDAPEDATTLASLAKAGVSVVVIPNATSIAQVAPRITATALALGIPDVGATLVSSLQGRMTVPASPPAAGKRVAFLYLRGSAGVYLLGGKGSGADDLIARLGGVDVGTELGVKGFGPLTAEELTKANPDILLLMTKGLESVGGIDKLLAMPGVSGTRAAAHRAVITAQDERLLSFGPGTPDVVDCLAQQIEALSE